MKEKKTIINLVSFDDVVATGDKTKILEYMAGINLQDRKAFNSSKFMWMMKDKKFFTKVVALIRGQYLLDREIWKYGFHHQDPQVVAEYLSKFGGSESS